MKEYKKQTGQAIDGMGNLVSNNPQITNSSSSNDVLDPNSIILNKNDKIKINKEKDKDYNSTKNYKPSGIYNNDLLKKIQDKFDV